MFVRETKSFEDLLRTLAAQKRQVYGGQEQLQLLQEREEEMGQPQRVRRNCHQ